MHMSLVLYTRPDPDQTCIMPTCSHGAKTTNQCPRKRGRHRMTPYRPETISLDGSAHSRGRAGAGEHAHVPVLPREAGRGRLMGEVASCLLALPAEDETLPVPAPLATSSCRLPRTTCRCLPPNLLLACCLYRLP
jgi:hypothetical protein